jgi:hypothetical protein
MNKRTASLLAGALVASLMAGVVASEMTLRTPAPVQIVVQTPGAAGAVGAAQAQPVGEQG